MRDHNRPSLSGQLGGRVVAVRDQTLVGAAEELPVFGVLQPRRIPIRTLGTAAEGIGHIGTWSIGTNQAHTGFTLEYWKSHVYLITMRIVTQENDTVGHIGSAGALEIQKSNPDSFPTDADVFAFVVVSRGRRAP